MAARVSQTVIAALSASNLAFTRASQIVVASIVSADSTVRASQVAITAIGRTTALTRASQITITVLVWNYEVPMPSTYPDLPGLAYSVIKRPKWFTGVATSTTGREVRVAYAQNPLWEWDLTYDYLPDQRTASSASNSDLKTLLGFYLSVQGGFNAFRFRDPDDHSVTGQLLGTTDGTNTTWVLIRGFGGADGAGVEPVGWIDDTQPFNIYLNGTLVDPSTYDLLTTIGVLQQVRFHTAPSTGQTLTCDMSYFYSVRFKDDTYDFEKFMDKLWSTHTVTLISQRN